MISAERKKLNSSTGKKEKLYQANHSQVKNIEDTLENDLQLLPFTNMLFF